ncbi:MAG: hypothetical protein FJ096_05665 [Deltaproteobacteria bacterium]|nr:hypothetical protein [Deltaproteobacteria bacterium]
MNALRVSTIVACLAVLAPSEAFAQASCTPAPGLTRCLPSDNLWPSARGSFAWLAPAEAAAPGTLTLGLTTSWIHRPIGLVSSAPDPAGKTTYVVENAISAHIAASVGLTRRLSFDVATPFTLYQTGAGVGFATGSEDALPRSAVGELRFGPSVTVYHRDAIDIAARFQVLAPTGSPKGFTRFNSVTFAPAMSASYRRGRLGLGADLGARIRDAVEFGDAVIGRQLSVGLGVNYDILCRDLLTVGGEVFALVSLDSQYGLGPNAAGLDTSGGALIPAEWLVSFTTGRLLDGKLKARVGVGGAIPTGSTSDVTAPALRTVGTLTFAP